jgi:hypothetical protein
MMEEAPEFDIDERASFIGGTDHSMMAESLHRNSVRASDAHIKFQPGSNQAIFWEKQYFAPGQSVSASKRESFLERPSKASPHMDQRNSPIRHSFAHRE